MQNGHKVGDRVTVESDIMVTLAANVTGLRPMNALENGQVVEIVEVDDEFDVLRVRTGDGRVVWMFKGEVAN